MFAQIIKTAKILIAAGQAKKLLQYLIKDLYKDNTPSQNEIKELKNKIDKIQKESFNFPWFVKRFIAQNKHYQDIDPLLKVQQVYKKLNKELRTFDFNDNNTFSDFNQFMETYLNKNVKNQEFQEPSYCKLIHSDGKYNYYYADAKDKKCYQDLHHCNMIDKNGQDNRKNQYAMWCVVVGTVSWGSYTTSSFPFYIYVTYKNNIPVMLCNFGYDRDSQIKDIHDDPFTQYDQELLTGIKQLAKKYNFDIQKNEYDFNTFNKVDELYYKQLDEFNIDQNIISESNKYNGLNFIDKNIVYDFKKNKKSYLIVNDNIVNLQGYKINLYLLNLLKDKDYYATILKLAKDRKFFSSCSIQIQNFIIQVWIDNEFYNILYASIKNDKIKDKNQIKEIIQALIDKKQHSELLRCIEHNLIKDEQQLKQSIKLIINQKHLNCIFIPRLADAIKDENIFQYFIQILFDNKNYNSLYSLIEKDKILDEDKVKQIIQFLIDNKQGDKLSALMYFDKIRDEQQFKNSIKVVLDNQQHDYLKYLIRQDAVKDENKKTIIQFLMDNQSYDILYDLIRNNQIKSGLLSQEEKALIKAQYPNIKLSHKLVNIAKIVSG